MHYLPDGLYRESIRDCLVVRIMYTLCASFLLSVKNETNNNTENETNDVVIAGRWENFFRQCSLLSENETINLVLASSLGDSHPDLHRTDLQLCNENEHFHCHLKGCCLELFPIELDPFHILHR